jgi:hypothetical protein
MAWLPTWYVPALFLGAAIWALEGTNEQASLAKGRLLADDHPLIAAAGREWTPSRLLTSRGRRRRRAEIEALLREDPKRWKRYDLLRREMRAWNMLESSVAIAAVASIVALLQSFL